MFPERLLRALFAGAALAAATILLLAFWCALDPTAASPHLLFLPSLRLVSTNFSSSSSPDATTTGGAVEGEAGAVCAGEAQAGEGARVAAEGALWLGYLALGCVFVALRLATLRVYSPALSPGNITGGDVYNHKETDERVFDVRTLSGIVLVQVYLYLAFLCFLSFVSCVTVTFAFDI